MLIQLRKIFFDISLLYKNFIHWNISKALIFVFSLLLWILIALPFLILLWILIYFDPINWNEIISSYLATNSVWMSFLSALNENLLFMIIEFLLVITIISLFIFWYSYKIITLTNLNFSYLKWEKINYFKNIYFDYKKILTYLYILSRIWLILFLPILVFVLIFVILLFSFWWVEQVSNMIYTNWFFNYFSIILAISFFVLLLIFLYLTYKMTFAYIIMLDEKNYPNKEKWLFYIKESYKITSWIKIFKFLLIIILITIFFYPIGIIWKYIEWFWKLFSFIYWIIIFLFLNWLVEMIFVSMYKNIMLDKIIKVKKEEIL